MREQVVEIIADLSGTTLAGMIDLNPRAAYIWDVHTAMERRGYKREATSKALAELWQENVICCEGEMTWILS